MKLADEAVAIVGMGCRFPGSPDLPSFWRTITSGRVCAGPVPRDRWDHDRFWSPNGAREANKTYARVLATLDDIRSFAPEAFGLTPRRTKVMDPQQRLFLDVVRVALEDAGYAVRPFPRARTGVFVGATVSDFMDILTCRMRASQVMGGEFGRPAGLEPEDEAAVMEGLVPMQAYSLVGSLMNMVAANVNQCFDLGGPSFTMDAACSSALVALHEATWQLRAGLIDAAVVGGVYTILTPDNLVAFARIGALSPSDTCRPYDKRADGFFIGEGLGAVVLRRLDDALAAGDHVYAVVRGIASNSDGKAEGPMTPRREGQVIALQRAYEAAGVSPRTVGLLEGHGTATPVGDATEIAAFRECLGGRGDCAVGSVKANIGHTMSAAGIAGLIKAALCVRRRVIPPQPGWEVPRPELEMEGAGLHVPREARDWPAPADHPRRAGVNAFGFGGTNVHVVLEEAPAARRDGRVVVPLAVPGRDPARPGLQVRPGGQGRLQHEPPQDDARPELVALSAPTPSLLARAARELAGALPEVERQATLTDLAATLALRRTDTARAAVVARDFTDLGDRLRALGEALDRGDAPPAGVLFAAAPLPAEERRVAFLFPGQGAQSPGLGWDLYRRFPRFRQELDRLAAAADELPAPLLSYLYPHGYPDIDLERAAASLTPTEVCQPAVAAVSLALARFLAALGVEPDVVVGHSLGEFCAAAAGGVIADDAACVRFVAARGRLIAEGTGDDPGAMAAVSADAGTVLQAIEGIDDVVLANLNHARQVVISGTQAGVAEAETRLRAAGLRTTRLRVSHAFHSPLMAGLASRLAPLVDALPLAAARVPVVSAVRTGDYPESPASVHRIFLDHATARVDFAAAVAACVSRGTRVFVQMGAGSALASMVSANAASQGEVRPVALTVGGSAPDEGATWLRALGHLHVLGVPVDLAALHQGEPVQRVPALPPSLLDTRPLWPVSRREGAEPVVRPRPPGGALDGVALDGGARLEESMRVAADPLTPPAAAPPSPAAASSAAAPAGDGAAVAGGTAELAALFREQVAMLESHLDIIRRQNELLARGGVHVSDAIARFPAASASRGAGNGHAGNGHAGNGIAGGDHAAESGGVATGGATAAAATAPAHRTGPTHVEVEQRVLEIVARITAHPLAKLGAATRLGADLGFDSLMVVELISGLQEAFPEAEPLARGLFSEDLTVGDIGRHLLHSLDSGRVPAGRDERATAAGRSREVRRYRVAHEPRPQLAEEPAPGTDAGTAPVVVLADAGGVAAALLVEIGGSAAGARARVRMDDGSAIPAGAHVVDLRGLGAPSNGALPGAADLRTAVASALALAQRLDGARPQTLLFAHRGVATAGLPGFAKALAREWPETRVCAVELDGAGGAGGAAGAIARELGSPVTAPEVRYQGGARLEPVLVAEELPGGTGTLADGAAVVLSGGASGLGARLALALARRHRARMLLIGRRPAGPEVERLLGDVAAAGGTAMYRACDVRDAAALAQVVAEARAALGPFTVAVHCAGVIQDAPVARKDEAGLARVFDTKVAGALSLWKALAEEPLTSFLMYGSWAGRFGNALQTDYAAANHALGRLAGILGAERPGTRVVTLDLPPWEGSTMLAGVPEAIRREMRARGVTFLSDEAGLGRVLAELGAAGAPSGEVLLGADMAERTIEARARVRLSARTHPFLDDHRINGRVVLPLAAALDLLRHAARGTGVDTAAGGVVRDLVVHKGVVFSDEETEVIARAQAEERAGAIAEAGAELWTVAPKAGVAYRARIAVAAAASGPARLPASAKIDWLDPLAAEPAAAAPTLGLGDFYSRYTFHGPSLRAIERVGSIGTGYVEGVVRAGAGTSDAWLVALDAGLQLCAYWAAVHHGRGGLPVGFSEMRFGAPPRPGERLTGRATLHGVEGDRFEGDLDLIGEDGQPVAQLRGLRGEFLEARAEAHAIDSATFRIEEFPEVKELRTRLDFAAAAGIEVPYFRTVDACTGATAIIDGREMTNFTSYNYVGLSGHPRIADAVAEAVRRYGSSVSASRVTGGQKPIHAELESEIAGFLGTEAVLVMVGGHATNVSVIGHLLGPEDLVLHDSLAHDSILGGARLAGARRRPFPHNDARALEGILREVRGSVRRVLVAVEGVYSMDGDIAPLPAIVALKKKYGALLFVDEAHSLGVLGRTGRGAGEHFGIDRRDVDIWMGTMSKTLSSCGGYVAGSRALIEYLKFTTPGFIYSVGITPANAAAALTALRILAAEPERAQRCQARARTFLHLCRERGVNTGASEDSAVVPCIVGNSYGAIRLAEGLLRRGIHVHPILYPAVPESMARLRFFVTAAHTDEQLRATADALGEELEALRPQRAERGESGGEREARAREVV